MSLVVCTTKSPAAVLVVPVRKTSVVSPSANANETEAHSMTTIAITLLNKLTFFIAQNLLIYNKNTWSSSESQISSTNSIGWNMYGN
jgi:hypothetical protein